MPRPICFLALALTLVTAHSAFAVIAASEGGGPSTTTSYDGNRNDGFVIVEDVAYDSGAGTWLKELVNTGSAPGNMLFSGVPALIDETFANVGSFAWTDWHERVVSITNVGGDMNHPGFLFLDGSLSVYRNGGLLAEGSDYLLTTELVFDQVSPDGDWEALSIFFSPGATIQPGDTLRITKDIFEVFGNGKIWELDEAAVLAQYPTVPEPASVGLALVGGACVALSRFWCRRRKY